MLSLFQLVEIEQSISQKCGDVAEVYGVMIMYIQ